MTAILEKLFVASARIERVIFIAGAIAAGGVHSDDLDEFFDEEDEVDIEAVFGPIPEWIDIDSGGYQRADDIFEWLRDTGKLGFLVNFATPVMEKSGENSRSFSWGYYSTKWIYAESMEEAVDKGLAWVAARRIEEDKKFEKKRKNS